MKTENIVSVYKRFPTENDCLAHIEKVRWHGRPACPYCTSDRVTPIASEQRHHCNACNTTFSATVNTIFHHTHLPLQKWFLALTLILNAKKGISARQLGRDLDVNRNTGWYLGMRVRRAMADGAERELLTGIVEMDETYIGGKPRPGGPPRKRGRGSEAKTPVVGPIERGGRVRAQVAKRNKGLTAKRMSALVRQNIDVANATVYTDEFSGYLRLSTFIRHESVDQKAWYVYGQCHRVTVRPLPPYLNEFTYRFKNRKNADVFDRTLCRALGCR